MAVVHHNRLDDSGIRMSEATAGDFFALLKPRVMSLVVFTAFVGLVAAPVAINPLIAVIAILCIAVGAGASGALNMWYDADIDARDDAHGDAADPGRARAARRGADLRPGAVGASRC